MSALLSGLSTLRSWFVLGLLLAALFIVGVVTGCSGNDEDPQVYYGPPPDTGDFTGDDDPDVYYGPRMFDTVDQEDPMVLYGPVPTDTVDDPGTPAPDAAVYYGPQPVDVAPEDAPPPDKDMMATLYGPMPVDVGQPTDDVAEKDVEEVGEPVAFYGPQQ